MKRSGIFAYLAALFVIAIAARVTIAQEKVLFSFGGTAADGRIPQANLTSDSKGNLYGTTGEGGAYDKGTVFELSPLSAGGWKEKVLYSFGASATDGAGPAFVTLIFDSKGNLYGTTEQGGTNETGTVFELSPEANGSWTEKVIYNFGPYSVGSVSGPFGGVIFDAKGNLYGSTKVGYGAVYELTPSSGGEWTAKILCNSLPSNTWIGQRATASLVFDTKGNLFGAAGGVFELSPTASGPWTFQLVGDTSQIDQGGAQGNLVFDAKGNLYGAATGGGPPYNAGTVFELSPAAGGSWVQKTLFTNFGPATVAGAIGESPEGGVFFDSEGNLYGTTVHGGADNWGTVFELSPAAGGNWTGKILHSFGTTTNDGAYPVAGVTFDAAGNLYGTTPSGGAYGATQIAGSVYEIASNTVATPKFSVAPGPYLAAQSVAITDATPGATIYYTTNGEAPTTASTEYTEPIDVAESETITAIAVVKGLEQSEASASYIIDGTVATPEFSPGKGTYGGSVTVTIADATPGSLIHYTLTGSAPTASSPTYSAPLTVTKTTTIEAIAIAAGYHNSTVASATFTVLPSTATPAISPATGSYYYAQTVTIKDANPKAVIYYTINGKTPTTASAVYKSPITVPVDTTETVEAIAVAPGDAPSSVATATLTIPAPVPAPTISPKPGTYTAPVTITLSDAVAGATIWYYINSGAVVPYSNPFTVSATSTVTYIAGKTGYSDSNWISAAYIIDPPAATPTFTPVAGTYAAAQTVTIKDATPGATIYWTLNGVKPSQSSTKYTGAINVSATETINAVAIAPNYSLSAEASALFTIETPAATPKFSVAAGTYKTAQSVTIADATAGAVIYYTTNGTTPTTASAKYTGPIAVNATETLQAIAKGAQTLASAVAKAAYAIQ